MSHKPDDSMMRIFDSIENRQPEELVRLLSGVSSEGTPKDDVFLSQVRKEDLLKRLNDGGYLHEACGFEGNNKIIEILIDYGVDIHGEDVMGRTPLHYAALNLNGSVLELLIDKGARIDEVDDHGFNVIHSSVCAGGAPCLAFLDNLSSVQGKEDLVRGMLFKQCHEGYIPLQRAVMRSLETDATEFLLKEMQMSFREALDQPWDLLHLACEYGHKDTVTYWVESVVNEATGSQNEYETLRLINLLSQRNLKGETPLDVATRVWRTPVMSYLKEVILSLQEVDAIKDALTSSKDQTPHFHQRAPNRL